MKWKTSITTIKKEKEYIHEKALAEIISEYSFGDSIFFLLRGIFPKQKESKVWNALLVAAIDHGAGTASAIVARTVASTGNGLNTAVGAGVAALGDLHGGAIESAARFFLENADSDPIELATKVRTEKIRVPGYGHRVFKKMDPRAEQLLNIARKNRVYGKYSETAENLEKNLRKVSGKSIPLNIDGAMAAIALDLGFPVDAMKGIFIIARTPGLVVQAREEKLAAHGPFRIPEEEIEYNKK